MEHPLTEAARRALDLARHHALRGGAVEVLPVHVCWALLAIESRCREFLVTDHGVTAPSRNLLAEADLDTAIGEGAAADVPLGRGVETALLEARRQVALLGRQGEIGTDHLLYGLAVSDRQTAEMVRSHGIALEMIEQRCTRNTGRTSEPIAVDLHLETPHAASDRSDALRILDAAANRAREGLRVVEDYARFALDDAHLTELCKSLRHELTRLLRSLDEGQLLAARDTPGDVGTDLRTAAEAHRGSATDVATANLKRVQEAARSLEEFGKLVSPEFAAGMEQWRYRLYTLEKAIGLTAANRGRLDGRNLYLLVTAANCHRGVGAVVRGAVAGGVGLVQVREKATSDRALVAHARRLRAWTAAAGALLIINDRPDLALLVGADGVHVGQDELSVREARRIVGPDRIIGVSTHTIEQARQAVTEGADYLGVGPVFPSETKEFDQWAGLEFVRQAAAEITLPWFAIGGITAANVRPVLDAGATRLAVSAAICTSDDPQAAAESFSHVLAVSPEH
ncbi:MAG: thiamine phosphate synthase [Planctomycetaceae bacterium]